MSGRQQFGRALAGGLVAVTLIACGGGNTLPQVDACDEAVQAKSTAPNVLVIMTDDQTTEQLRVMPQVQRLLADQGTTFRNMVVNDSDCCPSRATFLTGQQSRHHGLLWNTPPTGGFAMFRDQETTLPVALRNAGYRTGFVGKYLNRYGERDPEDRIVPPGWEDFRGLVWPAESIFYQAAFFDNGKVVETEPDEYVTHAITERAVEMINSFSQTGDPFFLLIGHVAPHSPGGIPLSEVEPGKLLSQLVNADAIADPIPEPKYAGRFANEKLPEPPSFNEDDVSDKSAINQRKPLDRETIRTITGVYRAALESLLSVDDSVATVIDTLEKNCMLDDTYVIYTSDNGQFFGEHRFPYGKYLPYLPSRSVPLVVRGPDVRPGVVMNNVVSNVDFAPTIAEWTSATLLREPDGISLGSMLRSGTGAERGRAVYLEGHAPEGRMIIPFDAVYTGEILYIEMSNEENEFYDLVADPHELDNRVKDSAYADEVAAAVALLEELRACRGSTCGSIGEDLVVPRGQP